MAQQADGTVYINSSINTDGFVAGGKEIEAAARRAAKTVQGIGDAARIALERQTAAFVKSNQLYAQQEQKVKDLERQLEEMSSHKVETSAFKEIQKQIDTDTAKLNRLIQTQEEFLATGGKESSSAYQRRQMQIEELRNSIEYAKAEQDELLQSGQAYQPVDTSAVTDKLIAEQQRLQQMGEALNVSYDSLKSKIEQYGGSIAGVTQKHGLLRKALSSVAESAKKAGAAMMLFHRNTKTANKTAGAGLKTILKYTLGIRSLYVLFNKVRNAIKEGFKNLAQYSEETNRSLSALKSSSTQLKNSLATAFAPILTVIDPILTRFINLLSQAATYVGMFFAALTGKNSFTKAVAVQEDYAASLGDTADNAKEAKKYLSGLDEIRTFTEDKDTAGGYVAPTPQEMFETVPIEKRFKELAKKLKKTFSKMFAPLKKAWDKYGEPIVDKIKQIKDRFVQFGVQIANFTAEWFENLNWEPLLRSVDNLLEKLQPLIDLILDGLAWAWENVLLPFGKWTIEKALPVAIETLAMAFQLLADVIEFLSPIITDLFENILIPYGEMAKQIFLDMLLRLQGIIEFLDGVFSGDWKKAFDGAKKVIESWGNIVVATYEYIEKIMSYFDGFLQNIFAKDWTETFGLLGIPLNVLMANLKNHWDATKKILSGITQFLSGVFSGNWKKAWDGIKQIFSGIWLSILATIKNTVNSIIGVINGMIFGIVSGINAVINALNKIQIDVPGWVTDLTGIKKFGFNLSTITAPQIPYLATGAVIPPNAPFAAVLGDQKNGRNLELPENLLRQIVREESGAQGFNGTIRIPITLNGRQILEAVVDAAKLQQTVSGTNPLAFT